MSKTSSARTRRVGVVAHTVDRAKLLMRDLGIHQGQAVAISPKNRAARGQRLTAILVDAGCWPMNAELAAEIMPALENSGYVYRISVFDPHRSMHEGI